MKRLFMFSLVAVLFCAGWFIASPADADDQIDAPEVVLVVPEAQEIEPGTVLEPIDEPEDSEDDVVSEEGEEDLDLDNDGVDDVELDVTETIVVIDVSAASQEEIDAACALWNQPGHGGFDPDKGGFNEDQLNYIQFMIDACEMGSNAVLDPIPDFEEPTPPAPVEETPVVEPTEAPTEEPVVVEDESSSETVVETD